MVAATLAVLVVMAASVVTSAVTSAAAVIAVATATAVVFGRIQFFGRGVAHGDYGAGIAHCLASELVVEVDGHFVVGDFLYESIYAVAVGRLHGHHGALKHLFAVELAVHIEDALVDFHNHVGVLGAESLFGSQREVEGSALLQVLDALHETVDHALVKTKHECVGALRGELEDRSLAVIAARLGRVIRWNPETETIEGDDVAASFLSREQRKGFELPTVD